MLDIKEEQMNDDIMTTDQIIKMLEDDSDQEFVGFY